MYKIVLTSSSQNRYYLMAQVGIPFEVRVSDVDENVETDLHPEEIVKRLAEKKALAVSSMLSEPTVVIAADTLVGHNGKLIGKPVDADDAFNILQSIQNRKHSVYTGVAIIVTDLKSEDSYKKIIFSDKADVHLFAIKDEVIRAYIATGEPFGKAGAYAVQGRASLFIERIVGDFYTVVGLPISKVRSHLLEIGIALTDYWK